MPATPRPISLSKTSAAFILCGLTLLLLTVIFPGYLHIRIWPLAFVALAPLGVCIIRRPLKWRWLWLYYLTGFIYFSTNLFWLWPVSDWGTLALAAYLGLYFVLFAIGLQRMVVQLRVPATIALPIAWTACEYVRGTFLEGGFPMLTIGNAFAGPGAFLDKSGNVLLQSADIFGVFGVTFFATIYSGMIVDLIRLPRGNRLLTRTFIACGIVLAATITYGVFRLWQYPNVTRQGPMVAVIQENIEQNLKDNRNEFPSYFASHVKLTEEAIEKYKPRLVVWPETMSPYPFNPTRLELMREVIESPARMARLDDEMQNTVRQTLQTYETLCQIANRHRVHLVVGNMSVEESSTDVEKRNTAALIAPGKGEVTRYAKSHLVPFGEYIPFAGKGTWLRGFLMKLTPLDYDYSLEPGKEWTIFTLPPQGGLGSAATDGSGGLPTHFATPICFEDIMPGPARAMAAIDSTGNKRVDYLVNISNDGWFLQTELDLHLQASQVRAIENRVPIARSVNTGNSGFIDSCGRIRQLIGPHRIGTAGWQMEIDSRITLYSRIGDLLPILCGIAGVLMVAWTFVRPRRGAQYRERK